MLYERSLRHWLNHTSFNAGPYNGPTRAALVRPDGTLTPLDLTDSWGTRAILNTEHGAIAEVTQIPATGEWGGTAMNPANRNLLYSTGSTAQEAAYAVLVLLYTSEADAARMAREPAYRAQRLLERMDWYSHMSDDHSVWAAGERDSRDLRAALDELPVTEAREVWATYAPTDTTCPV